MSGWADAASQLFMDRFDPDIEALAPGFTVPVAAHVNGSDGVVASVRRWTDGSYHFELVRLRAEGRPPCWEVDTVTGSSLAGSSEPGDGTDEGDGGAGNPSEPWPHPAPQLLHHGTVEEEGTDVVLVELLLRVSSDTRFLRLSTTLESVDEAVSSPLGYATFIIHSDEPPHLVRIERIPRLDAPEGAAIGELAATTGVLRRNSSAEGVVIEYGARSGRHREGRHRPPQR